MEIRLRETGELFSEAGFKEYLRAKAELAGERLSLPLGTSESFINEKGADVVLEGTKPVAGEFQSVVRDGEELDANGRWVRKYILVDFTPEQKEKALADAKASRNAQINVWRAEANSSTFTHAGKEIACDALSRSDIDGVAGAISLTGAFPAGFPNAWKAVDNTYIPLPDINAFKDMYASMTVQGTLNFDRSQKLKEKLEAATTLAEINAITWDMPLA